MMCAIGERGIVVGNPTIVVWASRSAAGAHRIPFEGERAIVVACDRGRSLIGLKITDGPLRNVYGWVRPENLARK